MASDRRLTSSRPADDFARLDHARGRAQSSTISASRRRSDDELGRQMATFAEMAQGLPQAT
jgi:hypothetical protein